MKASLISSNQIGTNMGIESRFTPEQIAEFKAFEDSEIDRFLTKYWNYYNIRAILTNLIPPDSEKVTLATSTGIRKGLKTYIGKKGISIYLLNISELTKWYWDFKTVERLIADEINTLNLSLEGIKEYSDYISHNFSGFIYQDSRFKFRDKFSHLLSSI